MSGIVSDTNMGLGNVSDEMLELVQDMFRDAKVDEWNSSESFFDNSNQDELQDEVVNLITAPILQEDTTEVAEQDVEIGVLAGMEDNDQGDCKAVITLDEIVIAPGDNDQCTPKRKLSPDVGTPTSKIKRLNDHFNGSPRLREKMYLISPQRGGGGN